MKKIEKLCLKFIDLRYKQKKIDEMIEDLKKEIIEEMDNNEIDRYVIHLSEDEINNSIIFNKVKRGNIKYDLEKLKNKLNKEQKSVIVKDVIVTDYYGFIKKMKEYNIKPKDLADCIYVEEKVDTVKLKSMHDLGEIDLREISDCYSLSQSVYLRVSTKEGNE